MRISDWSSDVCSSDLDGGQVIGFGDRRRQSLPARIDHLLGDLHIVERTIFGTSIAQHVGARAVGDRSEERRVGKEVSVRVDLGGRRIIKKKIITTLLRTSSKGAEK